VKVVQRTDVYVGLFVIIIVGIVVAALIATSGWGIRHFDLLIVSDDVKDVAVDTRIYLQGLEIGRVASINPKRATKPGKLEFVIRASMLAAFPDKTPLKLICGMDAEVIAGIFGGATLELHQDPDALEHQRGRHCAPPDSIRSGDTLVMHRREPAMEALGSLATGLKSSLANAIAAATRALDAYKRLADSLSIATGTARGFVQGIRPGTESTLTELTASMARVRQLLDTIDTRSGGTMHQVDMTLEETRTTMQQTRRLMGSADSLTRLVSAMGAENRPEIRSMMLDLRFLTQQLQYVMEQLSRRPMRAMSGIQLPDSLTAEGRARRLKADSIQRADSIARAPRPAPADSARKP
jgi:ABC-type transporter Mla subunit MlaD